MRDAALDERARLQTGIDGVSPLEEYGSVASDHRSVFHPEPGQEREKRGDGDGGGDPITRRRRRR
jgi:hypothetical protein